MLKILFVWLEGPSDEQFFKGTLEPILSSRYVSIHKIPYAERSTISINKKLHEVVRSQVILDYLWCADLDSDQYPCVTEKKRAEITKHPLLDPGRIAVVSPEIEAWYMAGLDSEACAALGIPDYKDTDSITKEKFRQLLPNAYNSVIDFRTEVLKRFSLDTAKRKNESFAYFCKRHLEVI